MAGATAAGRNTARTPSCCSHSQVQHTHTSAYVSIRIRQHTSAYVSIRQHTSACVSLRQHTSAYVSIRQHASAYVSIRQHTPAYVSTVVARILRCTSVCPDVCVPECRHSEQRLIAAAPNARKTANKKYSPPSFQSSCSRARISGT